MLFKSLRWKMVSHFAFCTISLFHDSHTSQLNRTFLKQTTGDNLYIVLCMVGRNGTKFSIWWIQTRKSNERWRKKMSSSHLHISNAKRRDDCWWLVSENCGWYNKNGRQKKKKKQQKKKQKNESKKKKTNHHTISTQFSHQLIITQQNSFKIIQFVWVCHGWKQKSTQN